jgi:hypothetical protein
MRRTWIQHILPMLFCLFPPLAAVVIALVVPTQAQQFYLEYVRNSPMDWLILGLGSVLFLIQWLLSWRALQWQTTGFNEQPDRWLSNLAQAAEWFPLLGLIGTVAGILQTFGSIVGPVTPQQIIEKYSPAITATGSGLYMALINIMPTWVVLIGRELIQALGGGPMTTEEPVP